MQLVPYPDWAPNAPLLQQCSPVSRQGDACPKSRCTNQKASTKRLLAGSLEGGDLLLDASAALLAGEGLRAELDGLGLPLGGVLLGGLELGVLADGLVSRGVDLLDVLRADLVSEVGRELLLEALVVLLLKVLHVLGDVATDNVLLENLSVEGLGLGVVAGEALLVVGDEDTTVRGTLHGTEDTVAGRGAAETDVEVSLEGAGLVVAEGLNELELTRGLGEALVLVGEAELGKSTAGDKETSGVSGGPVGETVLDAVLGELLRRGVGKNEVTLELGVDDLADHLAVGDADDKAVLGRGVLVLGLSDKTLTSVVVSLTLATTAGLDPGQVSNEISRGRERGMVNRRVGRMGSGVRRWHPEARSSERSPS